MEDTSGAGSAPHNTSTTAHAPTPTPTPAAETAGETAYLALVREVIERGEIRPDRTGAGTKSLFGRQLRFSLADGTLPLLTTKRVNYAAVADELVWFLSGSTNANDLSSKIWDSNSTREFLDSRGLTKNAAGDLGPVYGFQWRKWGAPYGSGSAARALENDGTSQKRHPQDGIDQINECVRLLRTDPYSRRIVLSGWNVADLDKMALPPCHILCQFYVSGPQSSSNRATTNGNKTAADGDGNAIEAAPMRLSCSVYQRSADLGLGLPFNIASYALLTHLFAKTVGMVAHELVFSIGDAHVYLPHIHGLERQLARVPFAFPKVRLADGADVNNVTAADFTVLGYACHGRIKLPLAV